MVQSVLLLALLCYASAQEAWTFPPFIGCPTFPTANPDVPMNPLPTPIQVALAKLDVSMRSLQLQMGTVGISAAVIYNQSLVWFGGYGYADKASKTPVTPDTIFRIGSITKVFTTTATMILRDRQLLNLDQEISEIFKDFQLKNPFKSSRGITFRQLATHTAGLPRESPCLFSSCEYSNEEIFSRLKNLAYIFPPETIPIYSNLGFSLLGHLSSNVSKMTYENLILSEIAVPLGLKNTGVKISRAPKINLATPYNSDGTPCDPTDCLGDFGWINPAGSMYSTASDLGKLLSFFLRDNLPEDKKSGQILDGSTIREMMRISWLNSDKSSGFAMPFEVTQFGEYMLRIKRGDVDGYASQIVVVPSLKLGLVVLTNIVEHAPPYAQAMTKILLPAFSNYFAGKSEIPKVPKTPRKFLGNYASTVSGDMVTVTFDEKQKYLTLLGPSFNNVLFWKSDLEFQLFPIPGDGSACMDVQTEGTYNIVAFIENNGSVTGMQATGLNYNDVYVKQNM